MELFNGYQENMFTFFVFKIRNDFVGYKQGNKQVYCCQKLKTKTKLIILFSILKKLINLKCIQETLNSNLIIYFSINIFSLIYHYYLTKQFVGKSMPPACFVRPNRKDQTPEDIFTETHTKLVKAGSEWLTTTSTSCSVVAALIATVVFVSCTTFPGGNNERSGKPRLERTGKYYNTLEIFMKSSLAALSFSVGSLMTFLGLLTSRHQAKDFSTNLPLQLLFGLSMLFFSVIAMLSSFCSGYFFVLEGEIKKVALAVYVVTFSPVCLFAALEFPTWTLYELRFGVHSLIVSWSKSVIPCKLLQGKKFHVYRTSFY